MAATRVLIDTNLFIEHIRARDKANTPLARIQQKRHFLVTSSIVVAELCYGARSDSARAAVDKVLLDVEIVPFTQEMAFQVAVEAQRLRAGNQLISFRDLAIACSALRIGLPVATHNHDEFSRVASLQLFPLPA